MDEELKKQALQKLLADNNDEVSKRIMGTTHKFDDSDRTAHSPGEVVDSYIGAPVRAGLAAGSEGGLNAGWNALKSQFGNDPNKAPTDKAVMEKMGISGAPLSQMPITKNLYRQPGESQEMFDIRPEAGGALDVSPAGAAGFGLSAATDPLTYVGGGMGKNALGGVAGTIENVAPKVEPLFQRTKQIFQAGPIQFPANNTAEAMKIRQALEEAGKINSKNNVLRKLTDG